MSYQQYKPLILQTAHDAIEYGLKHNRERQIDHQKIPAALLQQRACFVTLEINDQLRGCIGSLEAWRPLIDDINHNARAAAFSDPRFPPVNETELEQLSIHVSILSPAIPIEITSEKDAISQIRPGIDGLILKEKERRGTFLPTVWESLPEPADFLCHLKLKAGLPENYWSDKMELFRYTTEMVE